MQAFEPHRHANEQIVLSTAVGYSYCGAETPVEDLNALANAIAESPAELFNWNGRLS